jgi:hypothetical protein
MFMFSPLARVTGLSPCGRFCFVEGTSTGVPVAEIVEVKRPELSFSKKYRDFCSKLLEYYGRQVLREGSDAWGFGLRTAARWEKMLSAPNLEEARMLQKFVANYAKLGPAWAEMSQAISDWADEVSREQETTGPGGVPK